jgi:hypothetical protein
MWDPRPLTPYGPSRPVTGIAFSFFNLLINLHYSACHHINLTYQATISHHLFSTYQNISCATNLINFHWHKQIIPVKSKNLGLIIWNLKSQPNGVIIDPVLVYMTWWRKHWMFFNKNWSVHGQTHAYNSFIRFGNKSLVYQHRNEMKFCKQ